VYAARDPEEKAMQRALLQPRLPRNTALACKALRRIHREDLLSVLVGGNAAGAKPPPKKGKTTGKTGRGAAPRR
jgi:hypothetical protein